MSQWDGKERRKVSQTDHDVMIEIRSDVKHILEWNKSHKEDDDLKHSENLVKFDKIARNDDFQNKMIYGAMGVIAFVELIGKFIK